MMPCDEWCCKRDDACAQRSCALQNGMLEPFLASKGLADATQVLIYFAVAKLGEMPTDGVTDMNPEGLTSACGPWAEAVAARLHRQGLACHVLPKAEFRARMFEKLIWISAFMVVGAAHPGATVGDVEAKHKAEVVALIDELAAGVQKVDNSIVFGPRLAERLCAYARSVAHFPTAVKEFEWRNGCASHCLVLPRIIVCYVAHSLASFSVFRLLHAHSGSSVKGPSRPFPQAYRAAEGCESSEMRVRRCRRHKIVKLSVARTCAVRRKPACCSLCATMMKRRPTRRG